MFILKISHEMQSQSLLMFIIALKCGNDYTIAHYIYNRKQIATTPNCSNDNIKYDSKMNLELPIQQIIHILITITIDKIY